MAISLAKKDLEKVLVVGDRLLIKPTAAQGKTRSGLYLPPNVQEKENLQTGYIVKVGPGYPIPAISEIDEPWKDNSDELKYVPLQAKVGDLAVFMQKGGFDIQFNNEKYIIVPNAAVMLLVRDEDLFN